MKIKKLESIRGFAALYVVIHHFIGFSFLKNTMPPLLRLPFRFGQEAVILFFLLSGFVIYISVSNSKSVTFKKYLLKRAVRIFPITIIAFILSAIVALIGHYQFTTTDVNDLVGNLFMLQDIGNKPGITVLPFLDNSPLWSLSYEWWFYIMFYPVFIFVIKQKKIPIPPTYFILIISALGWFAYLLHPDHLFLVIAYFSLWWTGVDCADIYLRHNTFTFSLLTKVFVSLGTMTLLSTIPIIQQYLKHGSSGFNQISYPIITFRHYLVGVLVIGAGLVWWKLNLKFFNTIFGWFEKLAPISFGIYIIHFIFLKLEFNVAGPYITILLKLIITLVVSYLLELKLQPVINNLFFPRTRS